MTHTFTVIQNTNTLTYDSGNIINSITHKAAGYTLMTTFTASFRFTDKLRKRGSFKTLTKTRHFAHTHTYAHKQTNQ